MAPDSTTEGPSTGNSVSTPPVTSSTIPAVQEEEASGCKMKDSGGS